MPRRHAFTTSSIALVLLALGACADSESVEPDGGAGGSDTGTGITTGNGNGAGGDDDGTGGSTGTAGGGTGGEAATCEGDPLDTIALAFGAGDHVTMGADPALGLEQLTLETWVRRDGRGQIAGTGVGGVQLVPLIAKGRGEDDGSTVDCNYAFGLVGDVLGADFEDLATGANHPILGRTTVTWGVWHHVAATYDGTTWRLYLDGRLDAEKEVGATPRGDSIQHFALGTAMNSEGVPSGSLEGALDEVRVWSRARTAEEIAASMDATLASGDGLVARWSLDEASGAIVDTVGGHDGTNVGAVTTAPGAVLDRGAAPVVTVVEPADGAAVEGATARLAIEVTDGDDEPLEATFHLRAVGDDDDFTIVVLPDTQYYTRVGDNHDFFYDQTKWIVDNRAAYDIVGVIHNGDIVDNGNTISQWEVADTAMKTLEEAPELQPDGFPYGLCVGNHEQRPIGTPDGTANSNLYFGVDRFEGRAYYGGHQGSDNDESWVTFSAGGLDFVVVNFQFNPDPDPAVLAWARGVFESHPDAFGIVNSHYIVGSTGNFGPQGQAIYDALKDVPNVHIFTNGHIAAEARRTDTFEGHTIQSMLADYQGRPDGGGGLMRIWEFSPRAGELTVRTYSPTKDEWETDANSEFTLPIDLSGHSGTFEEVHTAPIAAAPGQPAIAEVLVEGLEPGRTYQWYATTGDCDHEVITPVASFTTAP